MILLLKNSEAKWRGERSQEKLRDWYPGGNLPYHAQYIIGIKKYLYGIIVSLCIISGEMLF